MICSKEDTKLINEVMRDFTNITKIAAIFVNNRGKVLSQEYNFSPFCKVVRRNPIYAKRCNQCDKRAILLSLSLSYGAYRLFRTSNEGWWYFRIYHGRSNKNRGYYN